jgi:hypothetical protein
VGINFLKNHWVLVFKIPSELPVLGFFWGQNKNQNQRIAGCGCLKNFKKEQAVFMKEQLKNWWLDRHS